MPYHEFAKDLVRNWLVEHKFKGWNKTETTGRPVTQEMKAKQAAFIAKELADHSKWRSHGRSLKIKNLKEIGLRITKVDETPDFADVVHRIQTVCGLLFDNTSIFKVFATKDRKIFRQEMQGGSRHQVPQFHNSPSAASVVKYCPNCRTRHSYYAKFINNPQIDADFARKGVKPLPKNAKIKCACGVEIDLSEWKKKVEMDFGRKLIF